MALNTLIYLIVRIERKFWLIFKVCRMQLESFGYNTNDLLFFWLYQDRYGKPEKAIDMGPGLELPQFRILGYRTADCTKKYTSGNYTCIKGKSSFWIYDNLYIHSAEFILKREIGYYMIQIYIPSFLIVVLRYDGQTMTKLFPVHGFMT